MTNQFQHADAPGLYRLGAAAARVGMTPETFTAACDAGEIPVKVLRIGPRGLRYVKTTELEAFLGAPICAPLASAAADHRRAVPASDTNPR